MTTGVDAARNLMRRSREEHFAVGAFNADNQETLLAIARAAHAKNAPVLVEVSHGEVGIIGLANMRSLVDNYRAEFGIEMYINLDHSPSVRPPRSARRFPPPKAPGRSSRRRASTRSPPPSETSTAATRSLSSSTSNSCNASATHSTSTSACTAAAAPRVTIFRAPRGSASARSTSTPTYATPTGRLWRVSWRPTPASTRL